MGVSVVGESYDCHFFRVTSKLSRAMSRDQVGALQATWQALEDAGIPAHALYKTRYGPLF